MPAIPYLSGGEAANASRMNVIFSELERKLDALLHGRSFLLAFPDGCPSNLLGKSFAFVGTDKPQHYTWRALANVGGAYTGGGANGDNPFISNPAVVVPHVEAGFTAVTPVIEAVDEVNHIMQIAPIAAGAYAATGHAQVSGVGFFENSLTVHKKLGTGLGGVTGQAGVTYYYRERQGTGLRAPERFCDWAVAEVLLEGVTSVTLPGDKYQFFRVHNLNLTSATVSFSAPGQAYSFTLAPFECRTVRRTRTVTNGVASFSNYRSGGRYLWKYEGGDPRFFWSFGNSSKAGLRSAMTGNNVVNPAIAWDWLSALDNTSLNAWWRRDKHTHADASRMVDGQPVWGDPSDPSTLVGDLIHHRGKIRIAKIHKTQKQPAPNQTLPILEWDEVNFNGYSTIVADFAAKGLVVRERSDGNLEITSTDANWEIDLVPVGTNLLKPWVPGDNSSATGTGVDTIPTVRLGIGGSGVHPIEAAIFDSQTIPLGNFSSTAPELVNKRSVSTTPNIRTYTRRLGAAPDSGGYPATESVIVTGAPLETMTYLANRSLSNPGRVMAGIHRFTVADLLKLDFWGDKSLASQDNAYTTHTDKTLRLTPEGLVLTYTEQVKALPLPVLTTGSVYSGPDGVTMDLTGDPATGFFSVKRVIRFRGHGWGYGSTGQDSQATAFQLSTGGSSRSGFWPAGHSRFQVRAVVGAMVNTDGKDFELQNLNPVANEVKAMSRIRTTALKDDGQFWTVDGRTAGFGGNPDGLIRVELNRTSEGGNWYLTRRNTLNSSPSFASGTGAIIAMALHSDHFNAIAAAVNAIQQGSPLTYRCLAWWVPSRSTYVGFVPGSWTFQNTQLPAPINGFAKLAAGSDQEALCQLLGVPMLGEDDLPDNFASVKSQTNTRQEIIAKCVVTGSFQSGITVDISFEVGATLEEAAGYVYMPLASPAAAPLFASMNTFPPPVLPATVQQYPANTLNLATAYGGLQWTNIESVKAVVEAVGMKFVHAEVFEPMSLEVVNKGSSISEVDGSNKSVGPITFFPPKANGSPGTPRPTVRFSRMSKMIIFRQSESADDVKWKRPLPEFTGGSTIYIHNTTIRGTHIPEFANLHGLWSVKFVQQPPATHADGAYAYLNTSFIPKEEGGSDVTHGQWVRGGALAIEYVPNDLSYQRWAKWALHEERLIAIQVINSTGVASSNEVYLSPTSTWTGQKDWWADTLDGYFLGMTGFTNFLTSITPQVFVPPKPARKVTCGPGVTLVRAEEDSRYACLFDIRNNLLNLA